MYTEGQAYRLIGFPDELEADSMDLFVEKVRLLAEESRVPILADFTGRKNLYSYGIGALVNAYRLCNEKKVYFGIVNIDGNVHSIIRVTGLDKVLNILPSLADFAELELEDGIIGIRVPPLEFSYEEKDLNGHKLIACRGVMSEGKILDQMMEEVESLDLVIFDLTKLSFMDGDCLDTFTDFCGNIKVYVFGVNDIVDEELKQFGLDEKVILKSSLEEIRKDLGF
ncbi:STAS domain-containing protein [Fibrobacterota bacterium]